MRATPSYGGYLGVDHQGCVDQGDHRGAAAALSGYDGLREDQGAELVTAVCALIHGVWQPVRGRRCARPPASWPGRSAQAQRSAVLVDGFLGPTGERTGVAGMFSGKRHAAQFTSRRWLTERLAGRRQAGPLPRRP